MLQILSSLSLPSVRIPKYFLVENLRAVEYAFLHIAAVGHAPDLAAQRIHLMHQLRLGRPAHCWVAGLQKINHCCYISVQQAVMYT